jgi:hypothetical protein
MEKDETRERPETRFASEFMLVKVLGDMMRGVNINAAAKNKFDVMIGQSKLTYRLQDGSTTLAITTKHKEMERKLKEVKATLRLTGVGAVAVWLAFNKIVDYFEGKGPLEIVKYTAVKNFVI